MQSCGSFPPATAASYRVGDAASIVPGNPASMPFGGNIDGVQVFGAPISASQIAATHAARCGGTCLRGGSDLLCFRLWRRVSS